MASGDANETDRYVARLDPEEIFEQFVRNAMLVARDARTQRVAMPRPPIDVSAELPAVDAVSAVLLTRRKDTSEPPAATRPPSDPDEPRPLPLRDGTTARREALQVVPDVRAVQPPPPPVPEKSEDGQMPAGELDRVLADMAALVRWGHVSQVESQLDALLQRYPSDLLLLRRITEFYIETQQRDAALECLFRLSSRLFERRNVIGMRAALEQVLVLDPDNPRAHRLLTLLQSRPDGSGQGS
ncbi:MAG: hypothetical protein RMK74_13745 [Myxococcales bacterium]|nr:hypothetical protein [Myxococcales bacterium]